VRITTYTAYAGVRAHMQRDVCTYAACMYYILRAHVLCIYCVMCAAYMQRSVRPRAGYMLRAVTRAEYM